MFKKHMLHMFTKQLYRQVYDVYSTVDVVQEVLLCLQIVHKTTKSFQIIHVAWRVSFEIYMTFIIKSVTA